VIGGVAPSIGQQRSPVDVPEIDVDTLERHRAGGAPLIDVRQPDEYQEAHVPGAVLIPLATLPDRLDEIPADLPIYIICRSGGRSHRAAEFLIQGGFDATNVAGGTAAWIEADKPVVTGDEPG
jgi:rhodanese-related sulfurtransferase